MSRTRTNWTRKHRSTGVEFRCQDSGSEVYVSFNWNGTLVWEYVCSQGQRNAKGFAKFLRDVADQIESAPVEGDAHG